MTRRLYPWEVADVAPIARAFHVEANLGSPFNEDIFIYSLEKAMMDGNLYVGGIYKGGNLVGALCGTVAPNIMSGDLVAQELFWYVMPEHRGGLDAIKMFRDFESWSEEVGAQHVVMANFFNVNSSKSVEALYNRSGYTPIEKHHIKSL